MTRGTCPVSPLTQELGPSELDARPRSPAVRIRAGISPIPENFTNPGPLKYDVALEGDQLADPGYLEQRIHPLPDGPFTGSGLYLPPGFVAMSLFTRRLVVPNVYDGEAGLLVGPLLQMIRRLDQDDLQRRSHVGFEEMPAPGRAVAAAEYHVGVQLRLAFV